MSQGEVVEPEAARPDDVRRDPRVLVVAAAVVALAAGVAVGLLLASSLVRADVPAEGSAEAGFARDMQVHHAQAVEMSVLVRERSTDPQVRQVALDIELTQQNQQGQMHGWLAVWGLPPSSSAAPMAWMTDEHGEPHDDGAGPMPGMATDEQIAALTAAEGTEADRLFLELMVTHHVGGVDMARAVLERTDHPAVVRLAEAVVASQQAEIAILEQMLDDLG